MGTAVHIRLTNAALSNYETAYVFDTLAFSKLLACALLTSFVFHYTLNMYKASFLGSRYRLFSNFDNLPRAVTPVHYPPQAQAYVHVCTHTHTHTYTHARIHYTW